MSSGHSVNAVWLSALAMCAAAATAYGANPSIPKTPEGRPDLGGVWSNASMTNLQRPPGVQKLAVTQEEAAALVKANPFMRLIEADSGPSDLDEDILADKNADRGYNAFWVDPGNFLANVKGEYRTSWIVDPANGQMPLSEDGRKRVAAIRAENQSVLFHGPEALPLPERCLITFSGGSGPGMLNTMYNNNYQFVLTPDSLLIVVEMVHDARVIPIRKTKAAAQAAHRPAALAPWFGDSVGWWEGDTLVVETINVNPQQGRTGPIYLSGQGKVTERFTRVSQEQLFYDFTVEDPVYYSQPWRAEMSFNAQKEQVFEYACHEGNYSMEGILRGARNQEAQGVKPSLGPGIFGTPIPDKKTKGGGD